LLRKNLGDAYASPVLLLTGTSLSASFSSLPFSWLPWFLFSLFHFSWTCYSNGRLLQLIECIESLKSDVKKKMMCSRACDPCTKVTCEGWRRNFRECNSLLSKFSSTKVVPTLTILNSDLAEGEVDTRCIHSLSWLLSDCEFQSLFRRAHL
jgi:hypothetical protein